MISIYAKKRLLWGSIIAIVVILCSVAIVLISKINYLIVLGKLALMLGILMVLNLLFLLVIKYQERSRFRKTVKILTYLLPVFIIFFVLFDIKLLPFNSDLLYAANIIICFVLMVFAIIHIFLFGEILSIRGLTLIILYIVLSFVLLRLNLGDPEPHVVISFIMMGAGMYLFGLRCFFKIENNRYLKIVSFIACFLIYCGTFEMTFLSATYADISLIIYSICIFLMTLIVLLSLPVSGFIQWNSLHRQILKKLLIPWVFVLLIISVRFIFPELNMLFFREKHDQYQEFHLDENYQITNKNGLEPD